MPLHYHQLKRITESLLLTALTCLSISAYSASDADVAIIPELKDAFEKGNIAKFEQLKAKLSQNSLFQPYADSWEFRLRYGTFNEDDGSTIWPSKLLLPVLEQHDNTWAAERLRREWLEQIAIAQNVALFRQERPKLRYRPDQGVECADKLIGALGGQYVASDIHELVTKPGRLPQTCRSLFAYLHKRKILSQSELDLRLLNLVANNQLTNAKKFIEEFAWSDWSKHINSAKYKVAVSNPSGYLKGKSFSQNDSLLTALALSRLVKTDYKQAAALLESKLANSISPAHKAWLWGIAGQTAALAWDPVALKYYERTDTSLLNSEQLEWRVRISLLQSNWASVPQLIGDLPSETQKKDTWQYWLARAFAHQGDLVQANAIFAKIAGPFSFYGKLAIEELGTSLVAPAKTLPITAQELREAKTNLGLLRSLAFYDAGMNTEGFREFNLQTEQMNDRQLLAAANWALNNELYDRAIAAADRTEIEHDIELRYPTPFKANLVAKSSEIGVEDAWVYGVIRQESRFVTIARSHVGANGLMQVMPATAKYVAKKIGMTRFELSQVNQIDTNLTLGTSYLRMVREGLDDHIALASAGYNAGPSRPKTWRNRLQPGQSIEGALFAELIPFDETRDYVKNVLSNTMAYSLVLHGKTPPLKQRLGVVTANP